MIYDAYAIFSESTDSSLDLKLDTAEMEPGLPSRIFNKCETAYPVPPPKPDPKQLISIADPAKCDQIRLLKGYYRINGVSFLTMLEAGKPPVRPISLDNLYDIYPGYCILYDVANPPQLDDLSKALAIGTMGTAYDSGPSIFDCVVKVDKEMYVTLGHQCTYDGRGAYDAKAYLRLGGSDGHVAARIAIFKIG